MVKEKWFNAFNNFISGRQLAWLATAAFFVSGLSLTFIANGTCDDGDSIMHYQFARWAIVHHQLFFDHWAKPLYVLIACPFAQFGIPGIKLFNLTISSGTILLTFYIAQHLNIQRKALATVMMTMTPGLIIHSLSGLTEPLFAFVLVTATLLYLRNYKWMAIAVISFLPFVRSEGLIICGVFALVLLLDRRWLLLPLLILGHVVYGIAGYHIYKSLFWVFTHIPYARLSSVYGHGTWDYFFIHLPELIGLPLYALLIAGVVAGCIKLFIETKSRKNAIQWLLIYGSFLSCFIGHIIFWKFGIFNSLGLLRVLIGVLPMMAIIQLEGLNALACLFNPVILKRALVVFIIATVVIFPFTGNDNSWHYNRDFCLTTSQLADKTATDYLKDNFTPDKNTQYYFDANYISILLNIDCFDTTMCRRVWEIYEHPPRNRAFILWDNYYSAFECQTKLDWPTRDERFELVKSFTLYDPWNFPKTTVLFKEKL